jgi:parallel beta helix pectate lyase-like protein
MRRLADTTSLSGRARRLALCAAVAGMLAVPSGAAAADPACGDTVNHDVTLQHNLDCTAGGTNGLIVGKDGITIDLNGHKITGNGGADGYYGIDDESHDKVTVKNGTLKDWETGVYAYYGSHSTFSHLKAISDDPGNYKGFYIYYTGADRFDHVTSTDADTGFYLEYNGSLRLSNAKATGYDSYGVYMDEDAGDLISDSNSQGDAGATASSIGFYDYEGVGNTYVRDTGLRGYDGFQIERPVRIHLSHVTGNGNSDSGVWFKDDAASSGYTGNSIKNSRAMNNDYGFYSDSPGVASADNVALDNLYGCYYIACN